MRIIFIILGFILISSSITLSKAINQENFQEAQFVPDKNNYWKLNSLKSKSPKQGFVVCKDGYLAGPATADLAKIQSQKKSCQRKEKKYALSYLPIFGGSGEDYPAYQVNFGTVKYNLCKGFLSKTSHCSFQDEAKALAYLSEIQAKALKQENQKLREEKSQLVAAIHKEETSLIQELKQEVKREVKKDLLSEIYLNEELNEAEYQALVKTEQEQAEKDSKLKRLLQEKLAFLSAKDLETQTETNSLFEFKGNQSTNHLTNQPQSNNYHYQSQPYYYYPSQPGQSYMPYYGSSY